VVSADILLNHQMLHKSATNRTLRRVVLVHDAEGHSRSLKTVRFDEAYHTRSLIPIGGL